MVKPAGFEQRVFVVTTLSSTTSPTAAQINAGVEITIDLPDPINFGGTQNYLDSSDISTAQDKQQTGTTGIENLEFEIWRDKVVASQIAYAALPNGAVRYIVKFEGGDAPAFPGAIVATNICDVAEVTVGIKTDVPSPRNSLRRTRVPAAIASTIAWRSVVA
jgi:hypothetical protein